MMVSCMLSLCILFLQSKVYSVHEQLENKFNPSEVYVIHQHNTMQNIISLCADVHFFRLSSAHNRKVQSEILNEIISHPDSKFPEENVKSERGHCV